MENDYFKSYEFLAFSIWLVGREKGRRFIRNQVETLC